MDHLLESNILKRKKNIRGFQSSIRWWWWWWWITNVWYWPSSEKKYCYFRHQTYENHRQIDHHIRSAENNFLFVVLFIAIGNSLLETKWNENQDKNRLILIIHSNIQHSLVFVSINSKFNHTRTIKMSLKQKRQSVFVCCKCELNEWVWFNCLNFIWWETWNFLFCQIKKKILSWNPRCESMKQKSRSTTTTNKKLK